MKRILTITLVILSTTTLVFAQCSEADKQKLMAFDKAWGENDPQVSTTSR